MLVEIEKLLSEVRDRNGEKEKAVGAPAEIWALVRAAICSAAASS